MRSGGGWWSRSSWRWPVSCTSNLRTDGEGQGAPLNVLHLCQDGIRFQAAGPLLRTDAGFGLRLDAEGARIMVAAERVPGFSL